MLPPNSTNVAPVADTKLARQPLWVANPAVPLAARILAYSFWLFMLISVVHAISGERPVDLPTKPTGWKSFTKVSGLTIPYPNDWETEMETEGETTQILLCLPPGDDVRVLCVVLNYAQPVTESEIAGTQERLEKKLRTMFTAYDETPRSNDGHALPDDWHVFHGKLPGEHGAAHAMTGAWISRVKDNRILIYIASSPTEGWPMMRPILSRMIERTSM